MRLLILLLLQIVVISLRPLYWDVSKITRPAPTCAQILTQEACPGLTEEQVISLIDMGAVSRRDKAKKKIKWQKVESAHEIMEEGIQLRVYEDPHRFPMCESLQPRDIFYKSDHCLVVNKPHTLPVMAHPSNSVECLMPCVRKHALDESEGNKELFLVHRLDSPTSGLILLARSVPALRYFTRIFTERVEHLQKEYSTLTEVPVPVGRICHYQYKRTLGAQVLAKELPAADDLELKSSFSWKKSELEVLSCEQLAGGQQFSSTVRLLSGRKHQIRAQLAAIGAPCLGDTLYEPLSGLTYQGQEDERWSLGRSPMTPIGLHASGLSFVDLDGTQVSLSCPPPWQIGHNHFL